MDNYVPSPESLARWKRAFDLYRRGYGGGRIGEAMLVTAVTAREHVFKYTRRVLLKLPYKCAKCDGSGFPDHSVPCLEYHIKLVRQGGVSPSPCPPFVTYRVSRLDMEVSTYRCKNCGREVETPDENEHTKNHVYDVMSRGVRAGEVAKTLGISIGRVNAYISRAPAAVRSFWAAKRQHVRRMARLRAKPPRRKRAAQAPPPPEPPAYIPSRPQAPRTPAPRRSRAFEVVSSSEPRSLSSVAWDIAVRNVEKK